MSDDLRRDDAEFDREEAAFRLAFRTHGHTALPPSAARARGRSPWVLGAAAAILVAVLAAGLWMFTRPGTPSTTAGPTAPAGSEQATDAPRPGWKWVSGYGAMVQVPDTWGWDLAPRSDWCVGAREGKLRKGTDRPPYVAYGLDGPVMQLLCYDPPADLQTLHLEIRYAGDRQPVEGPADLLTRTVGTAEVVMVVPAGADRQLAQQVVDSAIAVEVDHNGCPTRTPVDGTRRPAPADITRFPTADSVSICQYAGTAVSPPATTVPLPGTPAHSAPPAQEPLLSASVRRQGQAASDLLAAVKNAPQVPGGDPTACPVQGVSVPILLRFHAGTSTTDVYVFIQSCQPGVDDGVVLRQLTTAYCADGLNEPPVVVWSIPMEVAEVCMPGITGGQPRTAPPSTTLPGTPGAVNPTPGAPEGQVPGTSVGSPTVPPAGPTTTAAPPTIPGVPVAPTTTIGVAEAAPLPLPPTVPGR